VTEHIDIQSLDIPEELKTGLLDLEQQVAEQQANDPFAKHFSSEEEKVNTDIKAEPFTEANTLIVNRSADELRILNGRREKILSIFIDEETRKPTIFSHDHQGVAYVNLRHIPETETFSDQSQFHRNWWEDETQFHITHPETNAKISLDIQGGPGELTPSNVFETYGQQKMMFHIALAIHHHEHCLLTGPTGTAKTTTVAWMAEKLNYNLVVMPINRGTEASHLIGEYMPGQNKTFKWVDGPVIRAARLSQTWPTILLIDEISRIGNVAEFARIYSLLDNQRFLELPEKENVLGTGEVERINAGELYVIATANPADSEEGSSGVGDYIGVQELDPALASRFKIQPPVTYPIAEVEIAALVSRVPSLTKGVARTLVVAANRIRNAQDVRFPISFRELEGWAKTIPYLGLKEAAEVCVVQKCPPMYRPDVRNLLKLG
jgi:MoxR-like ATPase